MGLSLSEGKDLAQIVIAILGLFYVVRTYRLKDRELQNSLWDKRMKVFSEFREILVKIAREANVENNDVAKFSVNTKETLFLFDSDIVSFRKEFFDNLNILLTTSMAIRRAQEQPGQVSNETHKENCDKNHKSLTYFSQLIGDNNLEKKFLTTMKLF